MTANTAASTRPRAGLLATAANFPIVFLGILVVVTQTDGADQTSLLNLWAIWGFLQALLGQVGLVSAAIDRLPWRDPSILARAAAAAGVAGGTVFVLRTRLFPGHESWWLAVAFTAGAVFLIGRLRGTRALHDDGESTVIITALENLLRTCVLALVVFGGMVDRADLAIVGPFLVSLFLLSTRAAADQTRSTERPSAGASRLWTGVLTGLPAVAAYALIPGLTLLGETADLDAVSIATSLLRGPLLVATFASAWILPSLRGGAGGRSIGLAAFAALLLFHVLIQLTEPALVPGLILHGVLSGLGLFVSYLIALRDIDGLAELGDAVALAVAASLAAFAALVLLSDRSTLIHPFIALTAVAALVAGVASWGAERRGVAGT